MADESQVPEQASEQTKAMARDPEGAAGQVPVQAKGDLAARLLTVAILGPLLLLLLFAGPAWGWALLIALAAGQATRELLAMTHPGDRFSRWMGGVLAFGLSLALYFSQGDLKLTLTALSAVLVVSAILPVFNVGNMATAGLRLMGGLAAPLYTGVLLTALSLLRRDMGDEGPWFVFFTLTVAWMGDTGGYTFGRLFGKTKLYPTISPKKTREGLLGSLVFSMGAGLVAAWVYLDSLPALHGAVLGVVGAGLGQVGDLAESLLKRSTGVKDSGSLLPGHGGLLDRIDALLLVGSLIYLYTLWR